MVALVTSGFRSCSGTPCHVEWWLCPHGRRALPTALAPGPAPVARALHRPLPPSLPLSRPGGFAPCRAVPDAPPPATRTTGTPPPAPVRRLEIALRPPCYSWPRCATRRRCHHTY